MVLAYRQNSPAVGVLPTRLNSAGPTRLPRLVPDEDYGPLTMARVMEFQFRQKFSTADTDGKVGPKTQAKLDAAASSSPKPAARVIVADLINERLRAYEDGILKLDFRQIKGGTSADPSTRGVFKVFKRLRHHTSSEFPDPPGNMDFSLFYHRGEALHQGPEKVPSHGCIHVEP